MTQVFSRFTALCGLVALCAASSALADNPLGLYVGFGAGTSQIENNNGYYDPAGFSGSFHDHDAAWKVIAGLRPISIVGAEIEYIDFGNAGGNSGYFHGNYDFDVGAHPKATVLFAMGYLPLPLPLLDVYGKLGFAHLQTDNIYLVSACGANGNCPFSVSRFDQENNRVAYGAGVQARVQDFAFRGEYERISSSYGDPATLMLSLTWTF